MVQKKVAIIGCGNWGTIAARIIGNTTVKHPDMFDSHVKMWVYEERVKGRKLSEAINTDHENIKYLPGKKIPENIVAVTDIVETCHDADILVWVIPPEFVPKMAFSLVGNIKPDAIGISLIKGLSHIPGKDINLVSQDIKKILNIDMSVFMIAGSAPELADNTFCEASVGTINYQVNGPIFKALFTHFSLFIRVTNDVRTVELCGALRNIVACAAGFAEGLLLGDNTKAAVLRLGMQEIILATQHLFPEYNYWTFFECCGIADVISTWYNGGRNQRICKAFVTSNKSLKQLEVELLKGQMAQGPQTAMLVCEHLTKLDIIDQFPLFNVVHQICNCELPPSEFIPFIRAHTN